MSGSAPSAGRGLLAGFAVLLVVAVPAAVTAYLALISFSGCLIECGEPMTGRGVLWGSATAVLLTLPVVAGSLAARVPLRRVWPWFAGLAVAAVLGAVVLQRVI